MDMQGRINKRRRSNTFPPKARYIFEAKSSRSFDSYKQFQPTILGSPFRFRRCSLDSYLANCDDGNQEVAAKMKSLFKEGKLSLARKNSDTVCEGCEYQEQDAKPFALSCLSGSCNYPTPSTICYLRGGDSYLRRFPFSVYKSSTENSFVVRSAPPDGGISKEFASTQSATGAVPSSEKREKTVGNLNDKHSEQGNEFESDDAAEERKVEWYEENSETRNIADERARYRERRKRNNASAKKSRDARRVRELETQMKAAFLERENMRLLAELMAVQQENVRLRKILAAKA